MTDSIETKLTSALDDAFPGRAVDEIRSAGPSWNDQNETVCVDFADGGTVFLKIAADGDGTRIARECAVIDYVNTHCDVAVPSVSASQTAGPIPYLVTAPMRDRTLAEAWSDWDTDDRLGVVREVGAALADVHSCSFERPGHIVGRDEGGDDLVLEIGSWTDVLADRIELNRELASSDRFEHHFDEVKAAVESNRDRLDGAPSSLLHGDPAQPNIFHDTTSVGFIDWEIAHVGDPARELHRAERQMLPTRSEQLVDALRVGYKRRAGSLPQGFDERAPIYDAVWLLSRSGFFEKWVEFEETDSEAAAARLEAEMNRRLDAIR